MPERLSYGALRLPRRRPRRPVTQNDVVCSRDGASTGILGSAGIPPSFARVRHSRHVPASWAKYVGLTHAQPCDMSAAAGLASPTPGAAAGGQAAAGFGAALLPLHPLAAAAVDRTSPHVQVLQASTRRALPLLPPLPLGLCGENLSVALWAGPWAGAGAALRRAERAFGLPSPQIDGVRAKDSPVMRHGLGGLKYKGGGGSRYLFKSFLFVFLCSRIALNI